MPPSVTISANPTKVKTGLYSAIKWSVSGTVEGCTASGAWTGVKTPFGAESTGRLKKAGTYTYTLKCINSAGSSAAKAVVKVSNSASSSTPSPGSSQQVEVPQAPVYCQGALPCYGKREVAAHSSSGNCWGWNGTRVLNISGLDAGYHKVKTGVSSIEVSGVCGTDLAPSLAGSVSAGGQTRDHNNTTKANADSNLFPYFVGYYDGTKP